MSDFDALNELDVDTREGEKASLWEERFEAQVNTFFDEAIGRVPGFVDRHLKSFKKTRLLSWPQLYGMAFRETYVRHTSAFKVKLTTVCDCTLQVCKSTLTT